MKSGLAQPSRRRFLRHSGAGLTVALFAGCALPVIPRRPMPSLDDALGWIRHQDGRYLLWVPRIEMGQNILNGLKRIACAELGVPWERVELRLPSTADIGRVKASVGSESIKDYALPLAQACALLREAVARGGFAAAAEQAPAALRSLGPSNALAGLPTSPLEQGEAIVTGRPLYVADVRRPGQLFGRVLYAPQSPEFESAPGALDEAAARAVPGFVALLRDARLVQGRARGLGLVAATPGALDRIERALALQWQMAEPSPKPAGDWAAALDVDLALAAGRRLPHAVGDDAGPIDPDGAWDLDLRFDIPSAAHAALEPRAAVAEFDAARGELRLWVGSQDVFYQRDVVAQRLGLDAEKVLVQACRVGGAFGSKTICTVELEAALLAQAVRRPVKVQWTRAQELRQGFHRAPSSHRVRVRLRQGRLQDWWHAFVSSHILFTNAAMPVWMQQVSRLVGDAGVARGAQLPYRAARRETRFALVRLPLLTGPWRGLGAGSNHFVVESVVDECARRLGQDPLAFRLAHLDAAASPPQARLARVLQRVARRARWGDAPPAPAPGERTGRGLACGIYKDMSYAAVVADVVVAASGEVRVTRLCCAHDCGRVIDAEQVRAQCEGNLVWGLGMVLVEALAFDGRAVGASGFADSPIPRWHEIPPLEIELVDHGEPPSGAGETAIVAAGAAIANAIRAATGVRLRALPCRPEWLRDNERR
ncbi:molybdopterin-dependent oxidoreductase [Roseateles sp. DAIF2]|uniref:xanthine dehydrogenase family protein molybdopterin-binding subunit n=1 Tax=Roseateles sp. DAIF2 TaxID=2714952 RepID=UPI0018A30FB4|nr:molybdopterin cofactor-binding domain-containing protein [Roseateles sp. DAIF2]QPF71702.1 molybdopterin-dependent oxidoreductase [Roseateles sp. DAIF2]